MIDYAYDLETYPNCFTFTGKLCQGGDPVQFEISDRVNQSAELVEYLKPMANTHRMVGFNNLGFDYPILHMLLRAGRMDAATLYQKAMAIIGSQDTDSRWSHMVYPSDRIIPQIDLYKIHHFDNNARRTSLKALEFAMRSESVDDLPFPVGTVLTPDQMDTLLEYNLHDVEETIKFYHYSKDMIRFREELTAKYKRDFMNHNDTKIGKDYFIMRLEEAGVPCYDIGPDGRTPRQTPRPQIALRDAILPWIEFQEPEFQRVLNWLKGQTITETKGVFKDLSATVNGFTFDFGTGGIHGSVENRVYVSDDDYVIIDLDVTSYYPSMAIANQFRPEHLGEKFCEVYADLKDQRVHYAKGTAENAMLKLALNGVYGDSNSKFSVFYDPLFTMSITLNGQLLLCRLAEMCMAIPGLQMIQCNTDGETVYLPRAEVDTLRQVCCDWSEQTGLDLEWATYSRMFIRDVNSYISEYED